MPTINRIRDLVVVLPGIMGSVLSSGSDDLWAPSGEALWRYIRERGHSLDVLRLTSNHHRDPPSGPITATRLVPDFHGIFGLGKIDGYGALLSAIRTSFEFDRKNFRVFPYDWRLSNRVNARLLKQLIDKELDHLQIGEPETEVILIGHSMGGLVARYYLEVLEGWRRCGGFITFGTPFRGSVNAVDYLANGYKKLFLDLTDLVRSFPSVYELMPRYEMLKAGASWHRVAQSAPLPPGINARMAEDALAFHFEIDAAVKRNMEDPIYRRSHRRTYPVVGVRQKTLQSAELGADGQLKAGHSLPGIVDPAFDGGDGTVPRAAAIPIELSEEGRELYIAEQHASLQNSKHALGDMIERLRGLQGKNLTDVQYFGLGAWDRVVHSGFDEGAREEALDVSAQAWIGLDLEDVYASDEPVLILAHAVANPRSLAEGLVAAVRRVDGGIIGQPAQHDFEALSPSEWRLSVSGLAPGRYRARVRAKAGGADAPNAVTAIFEVTDR